MVGTEQDDFFTIDCAKAYRPASLQYAAAIVGSRRVLVQMVILVPASSTLEEAAQVAHSHETMSKANGRKAYVLEITAREARKYQLVCSSGAYMGTSIVDLLWTMFVHRWKHFFNGDGWVD